HFSMTAGKRSGCAGGLARLLLFSLGVTCSWQHSSHPREPQEAVMQGVETCSTDHAPFPEPILAALPTSEATTLYDVIAALQEVAEPGEDAVVVAIVDAWLRSGRLRFINPATIAA